jgi:hypothetical protein
MPLPELDFPSASGAIGTSALLPATGANLCASSTTQKSKRSIEQVAELEGRVMATELELEQIAAKRQEHETLRLARLLQLSAPTLDPAAPMPTLPMPSAPARTEQLTMFGPGPAKQTQDRAALGRVRRTQPGRSRTISPSDLSISPTRMTTFRAVTQL